MGMQLHSQKNHPLKILVVEDNPLDRALYKRMLTRAEGPFDFRIFETGSAKEGLDLSRQDHMDCILLDYQLPDADGIDFLRTLRAEGDSDTAIVMVTGQGCEKTAVEAMKLGALDYITKSSIPDGFFVQSILNAIERAQLKTQISRYQRELEKSNAALSDFTNTVAHDLKAALRRIISYCDILREEVWGKLNDEEKGYIDRLSVNTQRLHQLVDDLLSYARTIHGREEKVQKDLGKVVEEAREDLGAMIAETGAKITAGPLPVLSVYPVRIKQLFENLLSNAIKYRSDAAPVIHVWAEERDGEWVFSVRDNGLGIAPEYREKIFREFERLHSQDKVEGSGLGLAICQKVVELHDGRIWVEPAEGGGSVFKFTLPKE